MAQAGYTPISLYFSTTAAAVPLAANLAQGELAINIADGKLYFENSSGVVTLLASSTTVTNSFSAGTTGFTPNTATTGAVTLGGTLITSNGGTGLSSYTAGDLSYYASGTALTKLAIGTAGQFLTSTGTAPQWSTLSGVAVTTFSAGTTGFTPNTATSGAITLAGTLATTNGGTGLTSFTSGGVVYASSSSALATGSALNWDTNTLSILSPSNSPINLSASSTSNTLIQLTNSNASKDLISRFRQNGGSGNWWDLTMEGSSNAFTFEYNDGELLRITSAGNLGIGTSSPSNKLNVVSSSSTIAGFTSTSSSAFLGLANSGATTFIGNDSTSGNFIIQTPASSFSTKLTLDPTGNLGLGVTPSAWGTASGQKALQIGTSGFALSSSGAGAGDGSLNWNGYYNGTNWIYSYSGGGSSRYRQNENGHAWFYAPSGTAGNAISFTQAMTLDASGSLIVGDTATSVTAEKVSIRNNSGPALILRSTGDPSMRFYNTTDNGSTSCQLNYYSGTAFSIETISAIPIAFLTNNTERAKISSDGNFLVNSGQTNLVGGLSVGTSSLQGSVIYFGTSVIAAGAGTYPLKWNSSTGVVTYDTSSRLVKENIEDSPYGLAEVLQLKSRKYYRTDDQRNEIGLVADEVQAVMPEFVPLVEKSIFTKDAADTEIIAGGVNYDKLTSVLVKAIQELKAELDAYKASHP